MQKFFFKNKNGVKLCGVLDDLGKEKIVVILHGGHTNKDKKTYTDFQNNFHKIGVSSFRFDFTGHGESEGEMADDKNIISQWIDDSLSAIDFLREKGFKNFALAGSSRGGTTALRVGLKSDLVKFLVLICPGSTKENYKERLELASGYEKPVLIIHASQDEFIPLDHSKDLCSKLSRCELVVVEGANHSFTDPKLHEIRVNLSREFVKKHFG
jgi:pimeloyl-ACP methyl ester carboxylesterase